MENILAKYADLLVDYCLEIQPGDQFYLRSTTLAEPLVREVYRRAIAAGAHVEVRLDFREQHRLLLEGAGEAQLQWVSPFFRQAMSEFDAYLFIRAPFNLKEDQNVDRQKAKLRQEAQQEVMDIYSRRTATRELRRSLCQYPTQASAQEAGMSLEEYQHFVYRACKLHEADPKGGWLALRRRQQGVVDFLNRCRTVRYEGEGIDIEFSTEGRTWINSDGRTNMPSGEVYTSPVEDSVNGVVHFSYPGVYMGHEVEGVTLWVTDGYIEKWEARRGGEFLDYIFQLKGSRRFGEAAIGTNEAIDRMTKNILFDEKMGGTVHLAIGQSYLQAGGKNQSPVHWDMITDMREDGVIYADGERIYARGKFLLPEE